MYEPSRDQAELHEKAAAAVLELDLGPNVDVADIVARVATLTGKRIEIEPLGDKQWETVTGLVLQTATSATVLVRKSDPRWYQFHTVLHELSHVLFGHTGCVTLPVSHPGSEHVRAGQTVLARGVSTPDLDRVVDYDDIAAVMEAEAERLSQLMADIVLRPRRTRDDAVFG